MPPPKKPKTGTTWVHDFLSANELAELKQKNVAVSNEQFAPGEICQSNLKYSKEQKCSGLMLNRHREGAVEVQKDTSTSSMKRDEAETGGTATVSAGTDNYDNNDTQVISDNLVSSSRCHITDMPHKNNDYPEMSKVCIMVSDEDDSIVDSENESESRVKQDAPTNSSDDHENCSKVQSSLLLEKFLSSGLDLKKYSSELTRRTNGLLKDDSKTSMEQGDQLGVADSRHEKRSDRKVAPFDEIYNGQCLRNPASSPQVIEVLNYSKHFERNPELPHKSTTHKERIPAVFEPSFKSYEDFKRVNRASVENRLVESTNGSPKRSVNQRLPEGLIVRKVESLMMRRQLESLMDVYEQAEPLTSKPPPVERFATTVQKVHPSKLSRESDSLNYNKSPIAHGNVTLSSLRNDNKNDYTKITEMKGKPPMRDKSIKLHEQCHSLFYKYLSTSTALKGHKDTRFSVKHDGVDDGDNKGPITKLKDMCYSDTRKINNLDNSFSPYQIRFPYLYQSNLQSSGSSEDKNKAPYLASSRELLLDSGIASNVNNMGTRRPARLSQSGVLNVNEQDGCATKTPLSAQQNVNSHSAMPATPVNSSILERTSSEQTKETEAYHKRKVLPITSAQSMNDEKPPPLLPISNIMHAGETTQMCCIREPMDQEYEKQAMSNSGENSLLTSTHSNFAHLSTGTLCSAPYHFPPPTPPNFSISQGAKITSRSDSYPSSTSTTSKNEAGFYNLSAKDSFKASSCPSLVSAEPKFTGPIPDPIKSPSFLTQLSILNPIKVDSGQNDHGITSASSSLVGNVGLYGNGISSLDRQHSPSSPQRQTEIPSSTVDLKKKVTEDRAHGRRCQICNDNASGFHYGVWSCEGCKAFFKRSLQGPVDYVCPSINSCTIDKQRRKSCQACRLRKCVEMGMSRGNCRKERKSSMSRGPKRKSDTSDVMENIGPSESKLMRPDGIASSRHPHSWDSVVDSSMMTMSVDHSSHTLCPSRLTSGGGISPSTNQQQQQQYSPSNQAEHSTSSSSCSSSHHQQYQYSPQTSEQPASQTVASSNGGGFGYSSSMSGSTATTLVGSGSNAGPSVSSAPLIQESSSISTSQLPLDPLVEHLLRIDPPIRASGHDNNKGETEQHLMTLLMRLADTELVDVINWAKSIPGYAELEFQDRVHLLELCWMEIFILGILWHTLNSPENTPLGKTFVMASDLVFDRPKFEEINMWHIGSQLRGYLLEMSNLHVNQEEFVLLRALVLINSDRSNGENKGKISSLRDRILNALHYTVIERYQGTVSKVMNLLTLLPHIHQLGQQWIAHLVRSVQQDQLAKYGLLKEMIDAYLNCVDCTYCENATSGGHRNSQESRSSSLEPNGITSISPSLSPQSDLNV